MVKATVDKPLSLNSLLISSSITDTNQDLKAFLAKPFVLQSGTFTITDTVSSFATMKLPTDCLSGPLVANKLTGFLGIRATVVLRLQINGTRFQQGRYMLCVTHMGGSRTGTTQGSLWYSAHTNTQTARTQLPRIELDVNCDTEGIMKVPFVSSMNYFPLRSLTTLNNFGCVAVAQIFPYSVLQAPTGSTVCPYTVFCHLEDVELLSAAAPQSGRFFGASKKKSRSEKEQDSVGAGPISSMMVRVRDAASLWVPVPGISSYASGLSWLADISAHSASIFGWSKPVNLGPVHNTVRRAFSHFSHVDALDEGQALSVSVKNAVDILPGFSGTDVDEMDFSFLISIPAWIQTFPWNTGQSAGTALFEIAVQPNGILNTRTITGGVVIQDYTPMQFVSTYFYNWRGSLIYTFKIAKTEFHSGRLALAFFPHEDYDTVSTRSFALSQYVHREIVDIRESSTITITIPYNSSSPYRPLRAAGTSIGTLSMYVLDALVAPAGISTSVDVLTEIAGGPDFEFAVPAPVANAPVFNATPQSGSFFGDPKPKKDECAIFSGNLGGASARFDNSVNAASCIGEKVTSFRTLLKSTNVVNWNALPTSNKYLRVVPFAINSYYNGAANTFPSTVGDLFSALGGCYALSRGSVRIKVVSNATNNNNQPMVIWPTTVAETTPSVLDFASLGANTALGFANEFIGGRVSGPQQFNHVFANFTTETLVPQHHRYHSRSNVDHLVNTNIPYSFAALNLSSRTLLTAYTPGVTSFGSALVCRGGGDDCNFGVFVSIPPMQGAVGVATP